MTVKEAWDRVTGYNLDVARLTKHSFDDSSEYNTFEEYKFAMGGGVFVDVKIATEKRPALAPNI